MAKAVTKGQLQALAARTSDRLADVAETAAAAIEEAAGTIPGQMTGATASVAGAGGTVPAPAAGKQETYLRGDGTWATPIAVGTAAPTDTGAVWFKTAQ